MTMPLKVRAYVRCLKGIKAVSKYVFSKWFEPRSISSSYSVIVRVRVVLERTLAGDWRFDNLSTSHLQSQVNSICQSMTFYYVATIVRALWLAAERALFSYNAGHYKFFSRLYGSFELWVKLRMRGRKQQKRWTKYKYIFNNWKKN